MMERPSDQSCAGRILKWVEILFCISLIFEIRWVEIFYSQIWIPLVALRECDRQLLDMEHEESVPHYSWEGSLGQELE